MGRYFKGRWLHHYHKSDGYMGSAHSVKWSKFNLIAATGLYAFMGISLVDDSNIKSIIREIFLTFEIKLNLNVRSSDYILL